MLPYIFLACFLPLLSSAVPSSNSPQLVQLRVEGIDSTIFEGPVWSKGHAVTTPSGGTHACNGLNLGANKKPGATATSVLDDAAKRHGFGFDGTWSATYEDFFITSIGGLAQTDTKFWGVFVNNELTDVGGCQARVNTTDSVLWLYDAFSTSSFLKLDNADVSPKAKKGQAITFTVTDAKTGQPVEGAVLNGKGKTNEKGQAVIVFDKTGSQTVKAEREGAVRSNGVVVQVV